MSVGYMALKSQTVDVSNMDLIMQVSEPRCTHNKLDCRISRDATDHARHRFVSSNDIGCDQ